jgi:hypothetical protein
MAQSGLRSIRDLGPLCDIIGSSCIGIELPNIRCLDLQGRSRAALFVTHATLRF